MSAGIKLGAEVRCRITSYQGIAVSRVENLDGSTELAVLPQSIQDGYPKTVWINEHRLEVVGEGIALPKQPRSAGFAFPSTERPS